MKLLVVGIDGGDESIIRRMDMPVLKRVLDRCSSVRVEEDLWSRGWAEILSGLHGRFTGAFYSKPVLDGSHRFTPSFGSRSYLENQSVRPLWRELAERGHVVGLMNVPTTMPAPEVNGFFVSGAGGGYSGSGLPPKVIQPPEIHELLEKEGYLLDTRFWSSGIRDWSLLSDRLATMQRKRTKAFISLNQRFRPDFGFIAYMGTSRLQNLAMSEIVELFEHGPRNRRQNLIAELYRDFDSCLQELLEKVDPESLLVVSDHGAAPYRYSANGDALLQKIGLQMPMRRTARGARMIVRQVSEALPKGFRRRVATQVPPNLAANVRNTSVDWSSTKAFGVRYVSGVYLNDSRFGGPVTDRGEASAVIHDVIDAINSSHEAREHSLHARPYRELLLDSPFADLLPDVWIDKPDSVFFEGVGGFVAENPNYGPVEDLGHVSRDMFTGVKGRRPLLHLSSSAAAHMDADDPLDLTAAYRLINRIMTR